MSDWKPVLDELDTSDDGRQMEAMIDKLDEKQRAKQFAARVGRVVAALEPSQRKLLELAVFEGKSRAEIMSELGISQSCLTHRLDMIEKKLKKVL